MTLSSTPYDEFPYRSFPIEWTAPERLALASLLHGGPRQRLDEYRVLELGCGDGTNLLPMAYYRPHATFVGIDSAHTRIAVANEKRSSLRLTNITFAATDFESTRRSLTGHFDYIIAHGVFSWVSAETRAALMELCAERLRPGGLLYLNYNARPGWNVRGLIRDFLLMQTAKIRDLRARTDRAREIAARMAEELAGGEHPYSRLLANEFRFVGETDPSHTAHEYLAEHNEAYTRGQFLELMVQYGLVYVADADFNYTSGRLPEGLSSRLTRLDINADTIDQAADLVCYRQLHSPILTQRGFTRRAPGVQEFSDLIIASCLVEREPSSGEVWAFKHPSGYEVEARSRSIAALLRTLPSRWPQGLRLGDTFGDVSLIEDLRLLHRNGMIELRLIEPHDFHGEPEWLNRMEHEWGDYATTPYHTSIRRPDF
jgi:SAM-dependent methyltransferase